MAGSRKLGRDSDVREAMLRGLVTDLFKYGKVETTVTRAKEVRPLAEKMITIGKSSDLAKKRQIFSFITDETVAKKLIDEIAPGYMERQGGYTRITRTGPRKGDAAEMAVIELV
jgi:large subunit ribosomal protein L17